MNIWSHGMVGLPDFVKVSLSIKSCLNILFSCPVVTGEFSSNFVIIIIIIIIIIIYDYLLLIYFIYYHR